MGSRRPLQLRIEDRCAQHCGRKTGLIRADFPRAVAASSKVQTIGRVSAGDSPSKALGRRAFLPGIPCRQGNLPYASPRPSRRHRQRSSPDERRLSFRPDGGTWRRGHRRRRDRGHRPAPQRKHSRRPVRRHRHQHPDPAGHLGRWRRHPVAVGPRPQPSGRKLERPLRPPFLHPWPRQRGFRLHSLTARLGGDGQRRSGKRLSEGLPPVRHPAARSAAWTPGHAVRSQHARRRRQDRHGQAFRRVYRLRFGDLWQPRLEPGRSGGHPASVRHLVRARRVPVEPPRRLGRQCLQPRIRGCER